MFSLSDNNSGNGGEPKGAPGQEQPQETTQPAYITQEQLEAILAKQSVEFENRLKDTYRGMQSLSQKTKTQLSTLDATIKQMQAAGQQVDQAIVQRMKTDIIAQAYSEDTPQAPAPATAPGQERPAAQAPASPYEQKIAAYEEAYGVELFDEDPEVESIGNLAEVGEKVFFDNLRSALQAKKQRVASDTPGRALARSPFIGSSGAPASNPLAGIKDQSELWTMAMNKRGKRTP